MVQVRNLFVISLLALKNKFPWIYDIECIYFSFLIQSLLGSVMVKEKKKKNSQLIIRLNKEDKDAFIELCDDLDTSAAREVRHFIRKFLKQHEDD
jgi:hypothetical protein